MFQKFLAASAIACMLVSAPPRLVAQEKEVPAAEQSGVLEWFSGVWSEVAAWLTWEAAAESTGSAVDSGCMIDPLGCPHGG